MHLSASFPDLPPIGLTMIKLLLLFLLFSFQPFRAAGGSVSRNAIATEYRWQLLDMHGGAIEVRQMAMAHELKDGFPMSESARVLLEIANDENYSLFGRQNALIMFSGIASTNQYDELEPFYSSENEFLRRAALLGVLDLGYSNRIADKLSYAKSRVDWMLMHPGFRQDVQVFNTHFQGILNYSSPSESERADILAQFRNFAENAPFFECAVEADMLLRRYDPAWPASEARRAMIEKWIDDPGIHEKTKAYWTEALAAFSGPHPEPAASPGGESPDVPPAAAAADGRPAPVERNPNP